MATEDWVRDSEGKRGLDRERFLWSWFELADLWTDTMEAEEYEQFLTSIMALLTREVRDKDPNPKPNPKPNPNPNPLRLYRRGEP